MDLTTPIDNSEINMNITFKNIVATSILSAAVLTGTAHAAVIDQVKNKVDSIKNDTNLLKTRTSNIQAKADEAITRLDEVGSTVNTVIAETDIIQQALEPIRLMKDKFQELGFDPVELLESDELATVIQTFRDKQAAAQELLNDPDIETFRSEFSTMLVQIHEMLTFEEAEEAEPLPLQTLVELAPTPVIAALKFAAGDRFPKMRNTVSALYTETEEMRALGMWARDEYEQGQCEQKLQDHKRKVDLAYKASKKIIKTIEDLKLWDLKIEVREWQVGVHGYTGTKLTTGDDVKQHVRSMIVRYETMLAMLDLEREELNVTSVTCG